MTTPPELDNVEVHYQPIIDLRTSRLVGLEALARWRDPDGSLRSPGTFIDFAEQTGLITTIGHSVRAIAIPAMARWIESCGRPLDLHVNVSPREVDPGLATSVTGLLADSHLDPARLVLEVTESLPMADLPSVATIFRVLRERGVRIALDDFGKGWSSMDRLRALDVDMIKIDRSLVAAGSPAARSLTSAVVSHARARRLQVVAEGIEHVEQEAWLRELGCHRVQGFLHSRPVDAAEVDRLLRVEPSTR